jgi:hypothetical protein
LQRDALKGDIGEQLVIRALVRQTVYGCQRGTFIAMWLKGDIGDNARQQLVIRALVRQTVYGCQRGTFIAMGKGDMFP